MKRPLKYGIIGISIWILLFLVFMIGGIFATCVIEMANSGYPTEGPACWNSIQGIIVKVVSIIGFPAILIGGHANMSIAGPKGILIFWLGSLISFFLWGLLIGWIVDKIKKK